MLERARRRLLERGVDHVSLVRMDAAELGFADGFFDAVYAPYLLSVVPDPVRVAEEMRRVCRPGGRLVFLNHFEERRPNVGVRIVGALARQMFEVDWHLDLRTFLQRARLQAVSIERVNPGGLSSVLVCRC